MPRARVPGSRGAAIRRLGEWEGHVDGDEISVRRKGERVVFLKPRVRPGRCCVLKAYRELCCTRRLSIPEGRNGDRSAPTLAEVGNPKAFRGVLRQVSTRKRRHERPKSAAKLPSGCLR